MALVSILTPVKNAAPWIESCIKSVQNQSLTDWELLAINDGSEDNSLEILHRLESEDPRIKVYNNTGSGIIDALTMAYEKSSAPFITRMDADDLMPPTKLEQFFYAIYQQPEHKIVTGKVRYFSDEPISKGYQEYENWLNDRIDHQDHWEHIYRECVIASGNWMTYRKNIDRVGGFKNLIYPEDYDLVIKWYAAGYSILSIPQITHLWREHGLRTSKNSDHYQQEAFFRLKLMRFIEVDHSEHYPMAIWGTGTKGKLTAQHFIDKKLPFAWMDRNANKHEQGLLGKTIHDFRQIEQFPEPRLLIAVHPKSEEDMKRIKDYADKLKQEIGLKYWFL